MAKKCKCPRRTCAKRKGSRRFSDSCIKEFKTCQRNELPKGLRVAGKVCMKRLHQCARSRGALRRGRR